MSLLMDALKKAEQAKSRGGQAMDAITDQPMSQPEGTEKLEPVQMHVIGSHVDSHPDLSTSSVETSQKKVDEELDLAIEQLEFVPDEAGEESPENPAAQSEAVVEVPKTPVAFPEKHEQDTKQNIPEPQVVLAESPAVGAATKTAVRWQAPVAIGKPKVNRTYLWGGLALLLFCVGVGYYYFAVSYVERATAIYQSDFDPVAQAEVVSESPGQASEPVQPADVTSVARVEPAKPQSNDVITSTVQNKLAKPETPAPVKPGVPQKPVATPVKIEKTVVEDPVHLMLRQAYDHYGAGDLERAFTLYNQVLSRETDNRDALLGLAAIARHKGQQDNARLIYQRLLVLDPKDSVAASALLSLNKDGFATQNISQIKLMLQEEPTAAHLYYALANEYASQSRWPEAQQAYFQSYHYAPENVDYVFNLAVSLDKIGQSENALHYYRQALAMKTSGATLFDHRRVEQRIATLAEITSGK